MPRSRQLRASQLHACESTGWSSLGFVPPAPCRLPPRIVDDGSTGRFTNGSLRFVQSGEEELLPTPLSCERAAEAILFGVWAVFRVMSMVATREGDKVSDDMPVGDVDEPPLGFEMRQAGAVQAPATRPRPGCLLPPNLFFAATRLVFVNDESTNDRVQGERHRENDSRHASAHLGE